MKVSIIFFANEFKDEKDDLSVSDTNSSEEKIQVLPRGVKQLVRMLYYVLSFRGLVGGEATIVGSGDKHPAY